MLRAAVAGGADGTENGVGIAPKGNLASGHGGVKDAVRLLHHGWLWTVRVAAGQPTGEETGGGCGECMSNNTASLSCSSGSIIDQPSSSLFLQPRPATGEFLSRAAAYNLWRGGLTTSAPAIHLPPVPTPPAEGAAGSSSRNRGLRWVCTALFMPSLPLSLELLTSPPPYPF